MRIHGQPNIPPELQAEVKKAGKVENVDKPAAVVSSGVAETSASSARAEAALQERIAALKSQIESGTYKIDFDRLANRLIDEELQRSGVSR